MVGARHLKGTILSRVKNLLDAKTLKKPPLWYDVVRKFPPLKFNETDYERDIPMIVHPEDDLKKEFFSKVTFDNLQSYISFFPDIIIEETKIDSLLRFYKSCRGEGLDHDESIEKAISLYSSHQNEKLKQKHEVYLLKLDQEIDNMDLSKLIGLRSKTKEPK